MDAGRAAGSGSAASARPCMLHGCHRLCILSSGGERLCKARRLGGSSAARGPYAVQSVCWSSCRQPRAGRVRPKRGPKRGCSCSELWHSPAKAVPRRHLKRGCWRAVQLNAQRGTRGALERRPPVRAQRRGLCTESEARSAELLHLVIRARVRVRVRVWVRVRVRLRVRFRVVRLWRC